MKRRFEVKSHGKAGRAWRDAGQKMAGEERESRKEEEERGGGGGVWTKAHSARENVKKWKASIKPGSWMCRGWRRKKERPSDWLTGQEREGGRVGWAERESERVNFCMSASGHLHCGAQHAKRQQQQEGKKTTRVVMVWRVFVFFFYPSSIALGSLGSSLVSVVCWKPAPRQQHVKQCNVQSSGAAGLFLPVCICKYSLKIYPHCPSPWGSDNLKWIWRQSNSFTLISL